MAQRAEVESLGYPMLDEQDLFFAKMATLDLEDGDYSMWKTMWEVLPNYLCMAEQLYAEKVGYV